MKLLILFPALLFCLAVADDPEATLPTTSPAPEEHEQTTEGDKKVKASDAPEEHTKVPETEEQKEKLLEVIEDDNELDRNKKIRAQIAEFLNGSTPPAPKMDEVLRAEVVEDAPEEVDSSSSSSSEEESEEIRHQDEEVEVHIHESIDGSAPTVELLDLRKIREERRRFHEQNPHAHGIREFLKKLNTSQHAEFAQLFANGNLTREEKKKEIDAFLEKVNLKEQFSKLHKSFHDHRVAVNKKMACVAKRLPKALDDLNEILADSKLDRKQMGEKVKKLVRSLPKEVTIMLFKLKEVVEHHKKHHHGSQPARHGDLKMVRPTGEPKKFVRDSGATGGPLMRTRAERLDHSHGPKCTGHKHQKTTPAVQAEKEEKEEKEEAREKSAPLEDSSVPSVIAPREVEHSPKCTGPGHPNTTPALEEKKEESVEKDSGKRIDKTAKIHELPAPDLLALKAKEAETKSEEKE